jgi:hypothetical protein
MWLESEDGGVSVETDTRDKVIALGAEFSHFKREVGDDLKAHGDKIDEMYTLLTKARGVGWLGVAMLTVSSTLGGVVVWLWHHIPFGRVP